MFLVRNLVDIVLYAIVIYTIYLENVISRDCKMPQTHLQDGSVTMKVFVKEVGASQELETCEWQNYFLGSTLVDARDVMEFHRAHIALLIFLIGKEALIYWQCVRRAASKLEKEVEISGSKSQGYVCDDNYVRED